MSMPLAGGSISNSGKPGPHLQAWYEEKQKAKEKAWKEEEKRTGIPHSAFLFLFFISPETRSYFFDVRLTISRFHYRGTEAEMVESILMVLADSSR